MSDDSSTESRLPGPLHPKRSSADFDEPERPGMTKRLRIEAKKAKQKVKPYLLKRSHALFLEDLVDPLSSSSAPKQYCPESVDSFITQWVESVSASELKSYRERHCRSDTVLGHLNGNIIPRKSAPNMEYRRDADGFALPPTPNSIGSHLYQVDVKDNAQMSSYGSLVAPSNISAGLSIPLHHAP
ncbi:hypothetical protein B7494_g2232 [Chlorociboria aeruginascens]|nr:hypothetical protein B7494_g2232 [Chlorociboria aeruginascens]